MAAPSFQPPGEKPQAKSAADMEQELKAKAALQAMMDDLGIARVEALPLDTEHRDRGQSGHGHGHGYGHGHGQDRRDRGGAGSHRNNQPGFRGHAQGAAWGLNDAWKDAMAAGVFDDEDARGVKGLDDLGGGRIYDSSGPGSQHNQVLNKTMRILEQRNMRSGQHSTEHAPLNKKVQPNGKPKQNGKAPAAYSSRQQNRNRAPGNWVVPPSASLRPRPAPVARPLTLPPPQAVQPVHAPMSDIALDPDAPLPFELPDILFRVSAKFLSRDINPALPALIVLSSADEPDMGFFTAVIFNRKFCQWPISKWYDYATGADNLLGVTFQDGNSGFQGYELYFNDYKDLVEFMTTVRALKAGKHVKGVGSPAVPPSAPTLAPPPAAQPAVPLAPPSVPVSLPTAPKAPVVNSRGSLPEAPAPYSIPVNLPTVSKNPAANSPAAASTPRPSVPSAPANLPTVSKARFNLPTTPRNPVANSPATLTHVQAPSPAAQEVRAVRPSTPTTQRPATNSKSGKEKDASFVDNGRVEPTAPAKTTPPLTEQVNGSNQNATQQSPAGEPQQDTLISFDEEDNASVVSHAPSEATELLSTLDPFEYPEAPAEVSSAEILDTARSLFSFFLLSGTGGGTETLAQLTQMAEGVKSGVLQHIMKNAGAQGFDAPGRQGIKDMVDGFFAALIDANRKAREAHTKPSRIQYNLEEMMALKHAAVPPPASMADIPHLPKPGARSRQASTTSRGSFYRDDKPTSLDQAQFRKLANSMQWVLGETVPDAQSELVAIPESDKAPKPELQTAQDSVSNVASQDAVRDSGLQSSRWATGAPESKSANCFTGPAYEEVWKRSYMEELAQLDPQARVTTGTEHLVDFFFPVPTNDKPPAGQAAAAPGASSAAATPSRTDNIEILRDRMSRLSIWSPTGVAARAARLATRSQPSSAVMQASRALAEQTDSVDSPQSSPSYVPVQAAGLASAQTPRASQLQPTPMVSAPPAASPAPQPRMRGLAASRHSSGAGPSSSGNFQHHVGRT